MSELKATPGPWHLTGRDDGPGAYYMHIGAASSPMVLAHMNECHAQSKANAYLMAEAPDMYELLDTFPGFTSTTAEKAAWAQRVIEVKRKARGEQ
ncbi:hypothetical protein AAG587_08190 [Vreelandella neptunia]|uniref:hypothetical protein n=1 Tax=Vreelandella neptunia TaxID=115551 RepID=UPI003159ED5E